MLTGLEYAREAHPEATHVVSLATDALFLPTDLWPRLESALRPVPTWRRRSGGRRHPVFAAWPVSMAAALRTALVDGFERSMMAGRYDCAVVDFAPEDAAAPDPFMNLNTPEDQAAAAAARLRRTGRAMVAFRLKRR